MSNNIKKDAISSYANLFISVLAGFIIVPVIVNSVGKSWFGIYQFVFSLTAYSEIMTLGLTKTLERFVAQYSVEKKQDEESHIVSAVFNIYLVTGAIFILGVIFVYFNFDTLFNFTGTEMTVARTCFTIASFNAAMNIPASSFQSYLRGKGKYSFVFNVSTIQVVSRLVTVIVMMQFGFGIISIFLVDMIAFQLINVFFFIVVTKNFKIKLSLFRSQKHILTMVFGYTFFVFLGALGDALYWNTDNVILGMLTNSGVIAEYALSQRLVNYFYRFGTAFSGLFLLKITELYYLKDQEDSKQKIIALFTESSKIQAMMVSFVVVNFFVLGRDFIQLWVGPAYGQTFNYAVIILIPMWLVLSIATGIEVMYVMNRHKFIAVIYFLNALLNIVATWNLVQIIGPVGAAYSTAGAMFIGSFVISVIYYKKIIGIHLLDYLKTVFGKNLTVSILALGYGYIINRFLGEISLTIFLFKGVLFNLVWVPVILFVLMSRKERVDFAQLIRRKKIQTTEN